MQRSSGSTYVVHSRVQTRVFSGMHAALIMLCAAFTALAMLVGGATHAFATEITLQSPADAPNALVTENGTLHVPLSDVADYPSEIMVGSTYAHETEVANNDKHYGEVLLPLSDPTADTLSASVLAHSSVLQGEGLPIHIHYSVPEKTRMLYTELRLFDGNDSQVMFRESYVKKPKPGAMVMVDTVSSEKNPFEPGIYRLKVRITADTSDGVKTFEQDFRVYCYDETVKPLQSALIVRVSIPPLVRVNGKIDENLVNEFKPVANELNALMLKVKQRDDVRVTLSIPICTLKDWNTLAWTPEVKPESEEVVQTTTQPHVSTQERQAHKDHGFYSNLLKLIKENVDAGRVQVVYPGYDDPDFSIMSQAQEFGMLTKHYQDGSIEDGRVLPDIKLSKGAVPANLSLPKGTVNNLAEAGVTWMAVLPSGLELTDQQKATLSDVYLSKENPAVSIMKANPATYEALQNKEYIKLFDSIMEFHLSPDVPHDHPYLGIFPLEGKAGEADAAMKAIQFARSQPWSIDVFASELARFSTGGEVEGVDILEEDLSPLAKALKDASVDVNALRDAGGAKLPQYIESSILLAQAQSSGWRHFGQEGTIRATTLAAQASERSADMLHAIKVNAHPVKISGKNGDIPVVIKNNNKVELKVTVKAHGNDALKVADEKFVNGVVAGTLAGENYMTIPVTLTKTRGADHILTIDLYAGDTLISSTPIEVISSRTDLLILLAIALGIFFMLLFILRSRLSEAGTTEKVGGSDESMTEIIEKLKVGTLHHTHMSEYDDPEGPVSEAGVQAKMHDMTDTTTGYLPPSVARGNQKMDAEEHQEEYLEELSHELEAQIETELHAETAEEAALTDSNWEDTAELAHEIEMQADKVEYHLQEAEQRLKDLGTPEEKDEKQEDK